MSTFAELAASRRAWIESVLRPWCRVAARRELLMAEHEWQDIAGRPAAEMTLWMWAWGRFPALVEDGLTAINETHPVRVTLLDGGTLTGYPDARSSTRGQLVLVSMTGATCAPVSIDQIQSVERVDE